MHPWSSPAPLWACLAPAWTTIQTADRTLLFGGLEFSIRESDVPSGAGPNRWAATPEQVWRDEQDRLHLRIAPGPDGTWRSVEVFAPLVEARQLTFSLHLAEGDLGTGVVAAVFLYRNDGCELDFELSRWGDPDSPIAQYAIAPANTPEQIASFMVDPMVPSWHRLRWRGQRVRWDSWQNGERVHRWVRRGDDVPWFHEHRLHINLWMIQGQPPADAQPVEVVISSLDVR